MRRPRRAITYTPHPQPAFASSAFSFAWTTSRRGGDLLRPTISRCPRIRRGAGRHDEGEGCGHSIFSAATMAPCCCCCCSAIKLLRYLSGPANKEEESKCATPNSVHEYYSTYTHTHTQIYDENVVKSKEPISAQWKDIHPSIHTQSTRTWS